MATIAYRGYKGFRVGFRIWGSGFTGFGLKLGADIHLYRDTLGYIGEEGKWELVPVKLGGRVTYNCGFLQIGLSL